jgi:PAS domain S-box-containing protein
MERSDRTTRPNRPSTTELRERHRLVTMNLLAEDLSDGVVLLDAAGRVLDSNATAARLFGIPIPYDATIKELIGQAEITTPDGTPLPPERLPTTRALRGEAVRGAELALVHPNGSLVHVSISASPVQVGTGTGVLLILQDISDRVRRDREADAFRTLSQQLAGAEQDLDTVYRTVVTRIAAITNAESVRLLLYEPGKRRLRLVARHGATSALQAPLALDDPALEALAARSRLPVVVPDFESAAEPLFAARPAGSTRASGSAIVLPLIAHNELVGTLAYELPTPHVFDDTELAFLTTLANQSASAIANATLLQQRSRERAFLREVIDHLPAVLVVFEVLREPDGFHDYRVTMLNNAAIQYLPKRLARRAAKNPDSLSYLRRFASDYRARQLLAWLDEAVSTQSLVSAEEVPFDGFAHRRATAPTRYWTGALVPLYDRAGTVSELILLGTDITDQVASRLRIEELVRIAGTRAAEMEATVSAMADAVTVCDASGSIQLANRAALDTYGVDSLGALQQFPTAHERIHLRHTSGEPVQPEERPLARALAGETLLTDVTLFHHGLGRDVHRRVNAAPVRDSGGQIIGAVAVETDITSLIEIDRLKDEFVSMAAHELRTPLTAIRGYVQLLEKQLAQPDAISSRALRTLREQSERMGRLINELLDVARMETGQLEFRFASLELIPLLQQLIAEVASTAPRHRIALVRHPADLAPTGRWDHDRLAQVFANLLTNAVKYSPDGGTITVLVNQSPVNDNDVVISISDEGLGIPPDQLPRLFARYSRGTDSRHLLQTGLGLGLYITKEIIDAHGGSIRVDSTPGHGTTFTVTLPLRRPTRRSERRSS